MMARKQERLAGLYGTHFSKGCTNDSLSRRATAHSNYVNMPIQV